MVHTCKRCGHEWKGRKPEPPIQCPGCKSPYWQWEKGEKPINVKQDKGDK